MEMPSEPVVFMKAPNTLVGPNDDVHIPRRSRKTDWEVELAVVIGATVAYLESPDDAAACIAGYAVSNDVSEREFQLERGGQWDKGKSCATFNPLGPWIVTVRRGGRSAAARVVPRRERSAPTDRQHVRHDLSGRPPDLVPQSVHGARTRRRHQHRDAGRRRARASAAALPRARRPSPSRHRRARHTTLPDRCGTRRRLARCKRSSPP